MIYEYLKVFALSIVEGLTEFLPVSSTGHLIIANRLLSFEGPRAEALDIFIQSGAILAVIFLYADKFKAFLDFRSSEGFSGKNGIGKILVAVSPALLFGACLHGLIKEKLFNTSSVAYALIAGGVALIIVERIFKRPAKLSLPELSYKDSFVVGIIQCLALWPGFSRAGASILGAMICGADKKTAAEFSFILAVPTIIAATAYDLYKSRDILEAADMPLFLFGFIVSFVVAFFAIKFFLFLLQRINFSAFAYYRFILAGLLFCFL